MRATFAVWQQQTMLLVTHDNELASRTHRIIDMEDGKIISSPV
jgi:ABC-type lipoprotein export system ATPase subunit